MDIQQVIEILKKDLPKDKAMSAAIKTWRDVYYGMSLHISGASPKYQDLRTGKWICPPNFYGEEYQYLFDYFYFSRHPRETDEIRWWRYSQYKPMTKAPFGQIIEIVSGALFQDSNYVVELPDDEDREYIYQNRFHGYDLMGYFANIGMKNISEDPNGVFLRIPSKPFYEQTSSRLDVDVWFVHTKDTLWHSKTDLVFKKGEYAYWVNTETIWRFTYDSQKKEYYLAPQDKQGYYAHMMGKLPVTVAGGEWNTQGYFESYFDKAKAPADEFISTFSAAQMVDKEASHPFIVAAQEECPDCDGTGKVKSDCRYCEGTGNDGSCTYCDSYGGVLHRCGSCNGEGRQSKNPGQWMLLPIEKLQEGVPIQIVSPDVGINKHHRETVRELYETLLKALHLRKTDKAESGEAKAIDQEWLYQFLSKISNHVFDKIIYDTIGDIIAYRNVTSDMNGISPAQYPFTIIKPTQFQIKTVEDLLDEFEKGKTAGLPTVIRQRAAEAYVDKQYSGDAILQKTMKVINKLDTLSVYSSEEILSLRAANMYGQEDLVFHRLLPQWLEQIIEDKGDDWFLDAEIKDIQSEVDRIKKSSMPKNELVETAKTALVQDGGTA